MPYRLILHSVRCDEETPGLGSDEFWLSTVAGGAGAAGPGPAGETPASVTVRRWRRDDFDSGEEKVAEQVLLEGPPPERLFFACLGLEVDRESKARKLLSAFERDTKRWFLRRMRWYQRGGIYAALIVLAFGVASTAGALLAFVLAVVAEFLRWLFTLGDPDALVYDRLVYDGERLAATIRRLRADPTADPPVGGYFEPLPGEDAERFRAGLSTRRGAGGALVETRRYEGSGGRYALELRHELDGA